MLHTQRRALPGAARLNDHWMDPLQAILRHLLRVSQPALRLVALLGESLFRTAKQRITVPSRFSLFSSSFRQNFDPISCLGL